MNRVVSFVTLIALVFGAPTVKIAKNRIRNGENASEGEFPYQALLLMCTGDSCYPTCGGTIIAPRAVLTAAHCCELDMVNRIGFGSTSRTTAAIQSIRATGFARHEAFPKEPVVAPHDICIVHLAQSIKYSANVLPAALPTSGSVPTGTAVTSGWGSTIDTQYNYPDYPEQLQKATVSVVSNYDCKRILNNPRQFEKNGGNICAFNRNIVSPCLGDSGGPLVQNGVVIGITSWNTHPCGEKPTVYTAVSHYIDWIRRHTEDHGHDTYIDKVVYAPGIFEELRSLFRSFF